jgi:hypothetical protein
MRPPQHRRAAGRQAGHRWRALSPPSLYHPWLGGGGGRLRPKLRTSAPLHLSETRSRAHAHSDDDASDGDSDAPTGAPSMDFKKSDCILPQSVYEWRVYKITQICRGKSAKVHMILADREQQLFMPEQHDFATEFEEDEGEVYAIGKLWAAEARANFVNEFDKLTKTRVPDAAKTKSRKSTAKANSMVATRYDASPRREGCCCSRHSTRVALCALQLILVPSRGLPCGRGRYEMDGVNVRGPASILCSRVSKMELGGATTRSCRGSRRELLGECASCTENRKTQLR